METPDRVPGMNSITSSGRPVLQLAVIAGIRYEHVAAALGYADPFDPSQRKMVRDYMSGWKKVPDAKIPYLRALFRNTGTDDRLVTAAFARLSDLYLKKGRASRARSSARKAP